MPDGGGKGKQRWGGGGRGWRVKVIAGRWLARLTFGVTKLVRIRIDAKLTGFQHKLAFPMAPKKNLLALLALLRLLIIVNGIMGVHAIK